MQVAEHPRPQSGGDFFPFVCCGVEHFNGIFGVVADACPCHGIAAAVFVDLHLDAGDGFGRRGRSSAGGRVGRRLGCGLGGRFGRRIHGRRVRGGRRRFGRKFARLRFVRGGVHGAHTEGIGGLRRKAGNDVRNLFCGADRGEITAAALLLDLIVFRAGNSGPAQRDLAAAGRGGGKILYFAGNGPHGEQARRAGHAADNGADLHGVFRALGAAADGHAGRVGGVADGQRQFGERAARGGKADFIALRFGAAFPADGERGGGHAACRKPFHCGGQGGGKGGVGISAEIVFAVLAVKSAHAERVVDVHGKVLGGCGGVRDLADDFPCGIVGGFGDLIAVGAGNGVPGKAHAAADAGCAQSFHLFGRGVHAQFGGQARAVRIDRADAEEIGGVGRKVAHNGRNAAVSRGLRGRSRGKVLVVGADLNFVVDRVVHHVPGEGDGLVGDGGHLQPFDRGFGRGDLERVGIGAVNVFAADAVIGAHTELIGGQLLQTRDGIGGFVGGADIFPAAGNQLFNAVVLRVLGLFPTQGDVVAADVAGLEAGDGRGSGAHGKVVGELGIHVALACFDHGAHAEDVIRAAVKFGDGKGIRGRAAKLLLGVAADGIDHIGVRAADLVPLQLHFAFGDRCGFQAGRHADSRCFHGKAGAVGAEVVFAADLLIGANAEFISRAGVKVLDLDAGGGGLFHNGLPLRVDILLHTVAGHAALLFPLQLHSRHALGAAGQARDRCRGGGHAQRFGKGAGT